MQLNEINFIIILNTRLHVFECYFSIGVQILLTSLEIVLNVESPFTTVSIGYILRIYLSPGPVMTVNNNIMRRYFALCIA